jgi:23S rRNA pseudouridine2457 synthase
MAACYPPLRHRAMQTPGPYTPAVPLILLNKPYRVLSQFTDSVDRATLADLVRIQAVYPAGRLDYDSEGLLLLTDDGRLQARISQPGSRMLKVYRAQVEGKATEKQLAELRAGCQLKDGPARVISARLIEQPRTLWPRQPPIRERKSVPTSWIEVSIDEGRNRQVRRMTAAVGLPTLRLIRCRVGPWSLAGLQPGECREISSDDAWRQIEC